MTQPWLGLLVAFCTLFGVALLAALMQIAMDGWRTCFIRKLWRWFTRADHPSKWEWIDVRRDRDHRCTKPHVVWVWDGSTKHPYKVGDVIECKECGQRWKCTSRGDYDERGYPSLSRNNEYRWQRVAEDEDVFQ